MVRSDAAGPSYLARPMWGSADWLRLRRPLVARAFACIDSSYRHKFPCCTKGISGWETAALLDNAWALVGFFEVENFRMG